MNHDHPAPGQLIPVKGPVHLLVGANQGRFPFCHGVLIKDRVTCLVDPGCGQEVIKGFLQNNRVDLVLNTHSHPDHTSGNHQFRGVEVWAPEMSRGTAGRLLPLAGRFVQGPHLSAIWRNFVRKEMGFQDRKPDAWLYPGQEIELGSTRLVVMHTPGHTSDHCCFHVPELSLLLSADLDLTPFGPWYGHRESSLPELKASLAQVAALNPSLVVSSHRLPLAGDIPRAVASYGAVLEKREQRILALLPRPRTVDALVENAPIYGGFPHWPALLRHWEGEMLKLHLADLLERGLVRKVGRAFQAV